MKKKKVQLQDQQDKRLLRTSKKLVLYNASFYSANCKIQLTSHIPSAPHRPSKRGKFSVTASAMSKL